MEHFTYFSIEDGFLGQSVADVVDVVAMRRVVRLSKHWDGAQWDKGEKKENYC
jgi:hypothetical protein